MILLNSLITSITIMGFHVLIEFMLRDWFRVELVNIQDNIRGWKLKVLKPLFLCPICMTSVWGISIYFMLYDFSLFTFFIHIGTVGFFNYVFTMKLL